MMNIDKIKLLAADALDTVEDTEMNINTDKEQIEIVMDQRNAAVFRPIWQDNRPNARLLGARWHDEKRELIVPLKRAKKVFDMLFGQSAGHITVDGKPIENLGDMNNVI